MSTRLRHAVHSVDSGVYTSYHRIKIIVIIIERILNAVVRDIRFQFRKKTLGYDKVNVTAAKTLSSLYSDLQSTAIWYPGEGEPVIDFLVSVTSYLQKSYDLADLDQASVSFDNILSMLLENDSVVNEKVIVYNLSANLMIRIHYVIHNITYHYFITYYELHYFRYSCCCLAENRSAPRYDRDVDAVKSVLLVR